MAHPSPQAVGACLASLGWVLWRNYRADQTWAYYSKEIDGETVVIEAPRMEGAGGYARSVRFLIDDLARLERQTPEDVLKNIQRFQSDTR